MGWFRSGSMVEVETESITTLDYIETVVSFNGDLLVGQGERVDCSEQENLISVESHA